MDSHSAGAAAASWHPAFRHNSDATAATVTTEEEDDFFARYPGPTPKKNEASDSIIPDDLPEPSSPIRGQCILDAEEIDVEGADVPAHSFSHDISHREEIGGRPVSGVYDEDDEEALIKDPEHPLLSREETVEEQEQALEQQMPDEHALEVEDPQGLDDLLRNDEEAAEHYEHQGPVTDMEEALEPSAGVSLLQNEEPLPTTEFVNENSDIASARPSLDRSFTTNFSDSPIEQVQRQGQSVPDEWPSVGDDKTFGELLDGEGNVLPEHESSAKTAAREAELIAAPDSILSPTETKNQLLEATAAEEAQVISAPDLDLLPEDEGEVKEEDLAAAWGAALDDDDMLEETPTDLDPSTFFDEDDDGFLEDEPSLLGQSVQEQPKGPTTPAYRPTNLLPVAPQIQQGIPSPQFFNPSGHGRSVGTPSTGLHDVHNNFAGQQQLLQQRPVLPQSAQSFSDKSKGGYQSPYDLPMEVVKPRRRPQQAQPPTPIQPPTSMTLPRSSSIGSPTGPPQLPRANQPKAGSSITSLSPPPSRDSASGGVPLPLGAVAKSTPKPSSGFFEELPVTSKARVRGPGAGTPQPTTPLPSDMRSPPQGPPSQQPSYSPSKVVPAAPVSQQPNMYGGLRQPDRMPLLPDQTPLQQHQQQSVTQQVSPPKTRYSPSSQPATMGAPAPPPVSQTRYSPAPSATATSQPPAAAARYSPAPASQPMQAKPRQPSAPAMPPTANPFAPRTSSPLAAFTDKPQPPIPSEQAAPRSIPPSSPPRVNGMQRSIPDARYSPAKPVEPSQQFGPPLRRQSPEAMMKQPTLARSTSAGSPFASQPPTQPKGPVLPHRRQFSREFSFHAPQDERAQDPLQRWKGYPIFNWSASGTVLSTFPKQTPYYAAGQGTPTIKRSPGSIIVQDATTFMPMDEQNAKFPGPLAAKSKGRKKDVLAWMASKIEDLERQTANAMMDFTLLPDLKKRSEEKLILWKTMRIFVEHDGVLDGNAKMNEEVRAVLLPNLAQMAQVAELQSPGSAIVERDAVDKHITLQLRQALLEGQRDKAVWLAEEKRLWGHAMLIASTMGPETWKQIVQAFVRNQVKSFGSDARSLAALYQVFASNSEECVDELVPPSARAGFQMISMADGSVSGNPLEGLDQWRETLGLVTSNRTPNDAQSLIALGKLLAGYGRVEAAHTCYLFARSFITHSGPDDAEAHFVLLGSNHQAQDESFGKDLDSILLTEIYEYAVSLSGPSTSPPYIPHLQAFKLVHAQELAGYGQKTKAQTYCDAITSAYTSTTRPSPYYHPNFTQSVADLSAFLSQTPHDGKAGFLSRPALNKVSNSASSWFSKFVAGEDDQDSTGSGPGGAGGDSTGGPFGGVNGDSGSISRNASGTDLYNPMMVGTPVTQSFAPSSAPSRYTPGAPSSAIKPAPAQPYANYGVPATEPQRPSSSRYGPPPSTGSSLGLPTPELKKKPSNYSLANTSSSRRGSAHDTSSQGSYEPRPTLADETSSYGYSPQFQSPPVQSPPVSSPLVLAQQAPIPHQPEDAFDGPNGIPDPLSVDETVANEETTGGYEPPTGGYEPPSYSYQPYEPEPDSPDDTAPKPKKKMFGDDDDDEVETDRHTAALKKSQADKEADEMFRKAAEADAARDKDKAAQKKGWFGGWFGGSKDGTASPGPIKAKLGEESSFYYDENLKKWVNKKGGAEAATSAAPTPPPPKGPPARVSSAPMAPPSGPPSRTASGVALANMNPPAPTSGSGPGFPPPPALGPPSSASASRSGTPASLPPGINGESLAPPIRPASGLSDASSIDDLLGGPPGTRKAGGTVKGKKKGNRYVDVMTK